MSDTHDPEREEIQAAHIYRGARLICTVLIKQAADQTYRVYRPGWSYSPSTTGEATIGERWSYPQALLAADMFLAGFATGYDEGVEHGRKS